NKIGVELKDPGGNLARFGKMGVGDPVRQGPQYLSRRTSAAERQFALPVEQVQDLPVDQQKLDVDPDTAKTGGGLQTWPAVVAVAQRRPVADRDARAAQRHFEHKA